MKDEGVDESKKEEKESEVVVSKESNVENKREEGSQAKKI